jgi:hypothetical protein
MHPLLQLSQLSLLQGRWDGLDASFGQELGLLIQALGRGLHVTGLEQPKTQLEALIPASNAQALRELQDSLDQLESGQQREVLRELAEAWSRGDLKRLSSYAQWCHCVDSPAARAQLQRLNDARNTAMAQRISALHREGRNLLVAVGALHFTGPKALQTLLSAQGFSVKPLWPR